MNHVAIADIPSPEIFTQDVRSDGSVQWLRNGVPHRLNGPAMIEADGTLVYMEYGLDRLSCDWTEHRTITFRGSASPRMNSKR